jgi:hypothetical protein
VKLNALSDLSALTNITETRGKSKSRRCITKRAMSIRDVSEMISVEEESGSK